MLLMLGRNCDSCVAELLLPFFHDSDLGAGIVGGTVTGGNYT
jgi:hypothetical protein